MRDTRSFRNHGVHATESQGYWNAYSGNDASLSPEYATSSTDSRVDSFAEGIFQSPQAQQAYLERQFRHQQHVFALQGRLDFLKAQANAVSVTYRNFGLLFHSFPKHVIWHDAIHPDIRGFARANFLVGDGQPLPDIVHVIGTMDFALHAAGERMQQMWLTEAEAAKVSAKLQLAEMMVTEAMPQLDLLRQAVEVFCRMRTISWMEGRRKDESLKKRRQRTKRYESWAHAVPSICWGEFQDDEVDELTAAQSMALST